ncbi:Rid family hydrolase [Kitasatospora viridis]|uniref:Enamine deaminase RidA (YjgF/YER057c/UK114 family) n=1 Tax=Kitasatospora viridis TaxID=281105 RepID=A0A561UMF4_9ACTN|nr:Rid family hydrolase [Kitasatospora viridis]TWG00517.1 enamine deaminase RidA (YjgF/YER057c/UK114 family) [Kitasatospora viridis]
MTDRQIVRGRLVSDTPQEEQFGSALAVAAGDHVHVAGCTAGSAGGGDDWGNPYDQARAAFAAGLAALAAYGLTAGEVVRTRMYLTHSRDAEPVGRAHRELFAEVRPATTVLVVAGLADPRSLVEIELDAYRAGLATTLEGSTE